MTVFLAGCSSTSPTAVRFVEYKPEFQTTCERIHSLGVAVLPPRLEVTENTIAGLESRRDYGRDASKALHTAIEKTLSHGNLLVRCAQLADTVLATDQELALNLSRAQRSFAAACEKARGSFQGLGSASIPVNPEVGEFADRAGTDYLVLARGTGRTDSDGVRAMTKVTGLVAALSSDDVEPAQDKPKPDVLALEIGIVEASSARLVWYSRREGRVDLDDAESVQLACRSTLADLLLPPTEPLLRRGAIGLSVTSRHPLRILGQGFRVKPDRVCFVDVTEGEELLERTEWLESNSAEDGQVYLLNARPGRYAVAACLYRKQGEGGAMAPDERYEWTSGLERGTTYAILLSEEVFRLSAVSVDPGAFVFMGEFIVNESFGVDEDDPAQSHFSAIFARDGGSGLYGHDYFRLQGSSLNEVKRDRVTEAAFLTNALRHFEGTAWTDMIRNRLDELAAADEATED